VCITACGDNLPAVCGDGAVEGAEECDDGNLKDDDACPSTCVRWTCGDGFVRRYVEQCDDGAANSDTAPDACRSDCRAAHCGDGVLDSQEGCEDGNQSNSDACLNNCISATCGDGLVQSAVEECDDGAGNSSITPDACRPNCRSPRCGDQVRDTGEECDDANTDDSDFCLTTCMSAACGDGITHTGYEDCDQGAANSDTEPDACRSDCSLHRCGDTVVDSDETCDDGNTTVTDACPTTCEAAACGDGFLHIGFEQCDDGNASSADWCIACNRASCGDGFVFVDVEECDEGTSNSDVAPDSCRSLCRAPRCGDGVVDTGEACDASGNATVSCDADCTPPSCGDGATNVMSGETCDDGNVFAGDGCASCSIEPGHVVYVDAAASGANDGTSWTNAFTSLHDALAATSQGEIWVAAGTYYPDHGNGITADDPSATFALKSGLAVYGGFVGTELARVQRNVIANPTVLSGYIAGLVRSRHVVSATNVTGSRLDGFTIEWGRNSYGGPAFIATASSVAVANCLIRTNGTQDSMTAQDVRGGAILAADSTVTIEATRLTSNFAAIDSTVAQLKARGGAIYAQGGVLTIRDSVLNDNSSYGEGGAIFSSNADLRISNTSFGRNEGRGSPTSAGRGGAIYIDGGPSALAYIYNSTFVGNSTRASGWMALSEGGAIFVESGQVVLANSLLDHNRSSAYTSYGGALHAAGTSAVQIRNCTFAANSVGISTGTQHPYYGGAISVGGAAMMTIANSVFSQNIALNGEDIFRSNGTTVSVTYSCMQTNGWDVGTQVPVYWPFVFIPSAPNQTNYRLAPTSTCIDAGNNAAVPQDVLDLDRDGNVMELVPIDLAGRSRLVDHLMPDTGTGTPPLVDLGAYEKPLQ
jgi:cysteine-rich repeat protein